MIDLHCHILPGLDDGAADLPTSLDMARVFAADGVTSVVCTPHILPGLYDNSGPHIREAVSKLQQAVDQAGIPLRLLSGADNHIVPNFTAELSRGHLLSLADTRYVLVEPPHHVAPPRLEEFFFGILVAGYVPILTHPERLTWIGPHYATIRRLVRGGILMQITAASLAGDFGPRAQYWAERMLDEGLVHLLATDAHNTRARPPNLRLGRDIAAKRVGDAEADRLVSQRPRQILGNVAAAELAAIMGTSSSEVVYVESSKPRGGTDGTGTEPSPTPGGVTSGSFASRLRRIFS